MTSDQSDFPFVNLNSLRELLSDNEDGINEILKLVITTIPPALQELNHLMATQQWHHLKTKIHTTKIYYAYVGQNDLTERLSAWEVELASGKGRDCLPLLRELEEKSHRIIRELEKLIST